MKNTKFDSKNEIDQSCYEKILLNISIYFKNNISIKKETLKDFLEKIEFIEVIQSDDDIENLYSFMQEIEFTQSHHIYETIKDVAQIHKSAVLLVFNEILSQPLETDYNYMNLDTQAPEEGKKDNGNLKHILQNFQKFINLLFSKSLDFAEYGCNKDPCMREFPLGQVKILLMNFPQIELDVHEFIDSLQTILELEVSCLTYDMKLQIDDFFEGSPEFRLDTNNSRKSSRSSLEFQEHYETDPHYNSEGKNLIYLKSGKSSRISNILEVFFDLKEKISRTFSISYGLAEKTDSLTKYINQQLAEEDQKLKTLNSQDIPKLVDELFNDLHLALTKSEELHRYLLDELKTIKLIKVEVNDFETLLSEMEKLYHNANTELTYYQNIIKEHEDRIEDARLGNEIINKVYSELNLQVSENNNLLIQIKEIERDYHIKREEYSELEFSHNLMQEDFVKFRQNMNDKQSKHNSEIQKLTRQNEKLSSEINILQSKIKKMDDQSKFIRMRKSHVHTSQKMLKLSKYHEASLDRSTNNLLEKNLMRDYSLFEIDTSSSAINAEDNKVSGQATQNAEACELNSSLCTNHTNPYEKNINSQLKAYSDRTFNTAEEELKDLRMKYNDLNEKYGMLYQSEGLTLDNYVKPLKSFECALIKCNFSHLYYPAVRKSNLNMFTFSISYISKKKKNYLSISKDHFEIIDNSSTTLARKFSHSLEAPDQKRCRVVSMSSYDPDMQTLSPIIEMKTKKLQSKLIGRANEKVSLKSMNSFKNLRLSSRRSANFTKEIWSRLSKHKSSANVTSTSSLEISNKNFSVGAFGKAKELKPNKMSIYKSNNTIKEDNRYEEESFHTNSNSIVFTDTVRIESHDFAGLKKLSYISCFLSKCNDNVNILYTSEVCLFKNLFKKEIAKVLITSSTVYLFNQDCSYVLKSFKLSDIDQLLISTSNLNLLAFRITKYESDIIIEDFNRSQFLKLISQLLGESHHSKSKKAGKSIRIETAKHLVLRIDNKYLDTAVEESNFFRTICFETSYKFGFLLEETVNFFGFKRYRKWFACLSNIGFYLYETPDSLPSRLVRLEIARVDILSFKPNYRDSTGFYNYKKSGELNLENDVNMQQNTDFNDPLRLILEINYQDHEPSQKSLRFKAKTKQEADDWVKSLRQYIKDLGSKSLNHFEMTEYNV